MLVATAPAACKYTGVALLLIALSRLICRRRRSLSFASLEMQTHREKQLQIDFEQAVCSEAGAAGGHLRRKPNYL